ncbi:MAG: glycosyltransferase family 4 protein [Bacteroidota bacterium]
MSKINGKVRSQERPQRLLLVHNRIYEGPDRRVVSGENVAFRTEKALLEDRGHEVLTYERDNAEVVGMSTARTARVAAGSIWSASAYAELDALLAQTRPEVVHVHNTVPLISPAVYYAACKHGAAVIQTLHNYRMVCPSGLLMRDGQPCELCVDKAVPWPGVVHACYRSSRAATTVVGTMLTVHRALRTYQRYVHVYIALTEFARRRFIRGGLHPEQVMVKPNLLKGTADPGTGEGKYALFVGRLSEEKGIRDMLTAWTHLEESCPLHILGDGPERGAVTEAARQDRRIIYRGTQPHAEVLSAMQRASFLLVPSRYYEGFPMVLTEALPTGLPVIASRLGALRELVHDGQTGLHVRPADPRDLAEKVAHLLHNPAVLAQMRRQVRAAYEATYTPEANYLQLMHVYSKALHLARHHGR